MNERKIQNTLKATAIKNREKTPEIEKIDQMEN